MDKTLNPTTVGMFCLGLAVSLLHVSLDTAAIWKNIAEVDRLPFLPYHNQQTKSLSYLSYLLVSKGPWLSSKIVRRQLG